jgi:heme a synthase
MSTATATQNGAAVDQSAEEGLRPVAVWLFACCGLIFLMVVVGGVTRLTLSGLSITEWKPIIGIVPPLSPADWAAEFAKYQQIPEYRVVHYAMTLGEFKNIYFWEYTHRLLGRLIGVAFAVPFIWFLARRRLPQRLVPALAGVLLLGFGQGALGWYMVQSGLADRIEVSQYRLVAHLALALAIYGAILWIALGILKGPSPGMRERVARPARNERDESAGTGRTGRPLTPTLSRGGRRGVLELAGWRRAAEAVLALAGLTIAAGGFVAGTRAGLTYNTFPLMDGSLVPEGYAQLRPFFVNWFENIAAIQFNHRALAMVTFTAIIMVWAVGWSSALPKPARLALHALMGAAALQVALGISTLVYVVPIPLAAAHQAGAVLLLTAAIVFRHTLRGTPAVMDPGTRATI